MAVYGRNPQPLVILHTNYVEHKDDLSARLEQASSLSVALAGEASTTG